MVGTFLMGSSSGFISSRLSVTARSRKCHHAMGGDKGSEHQGQCRVLQFWNEGGALDDFYQWPGVGKYPILRTSDITFGLLGTIPRMVE